MLKMKKIAEFFVSLALLFALHVLQKSSSVAAAAAPPASPAGFVRQGLQITSHNIRLTFHGTSSVPSLFSDEVRGDLLNLVSEILTTHLESDIEVLDVKFADWNQRKLFANNGADVIDNSSGVLRFKGSEIDSFLYSEAKVKSEPHIIDSSLQQHHNRELSTNTPAAYFKIQVRHPTWVTPSASSFIIKKLRDYSTDILNFFSERSDYNGINNVQVETFDDDAFVIDSQQQPNKYPTTKPSTRPTSIQATGFKELIIPIQLSFEGVISQGTNYLSKNVEESIITRMTKIVVDNVDQDVELLDVYIFEGRRLQKHEEYDPAAWGTRNYEATAARHLATVKFFVEVIVKHPRWMTSTFARSSVMIALNENIGELSPYLSSLGDNEGFAGLSSISVALFDVEEVLNTSRPTHTPTKKPTILPTNYPTVMSKTITTHLVQLEFDGVTSASKNSLGVKMDLVDLIRELLEEHLESYIEVVNVELISSSGRELVSSYTDQHRMLALLRLPVEISTQHPASMRSSVAFVSIIEVLYNNFDIFGHYIQSLPGNGDYIATAKVTEYDMYEFLVSKQPTRIPTPPPALGSNTNSFPIQLVLNGISPYLIISENMKLKIATFIGNVVTANVDPEITLIGVSLQLDHMGRNLVVDQQYRMLEDWFILPLVVTLSYPSLRDDAFALVVVALTENIGVVQNYLQNDVGGVFCGMTGIVVEHNFVELDNAVSTPLNQISNAVPWWVWLVLAVGLLVVIVVFFGSVLYVKSKGESEKKSARSNAMQGVRARYSKRQASTRRASPKGKRETHHRSKSSIHRRQHSHKHHSPMLRTRQQPPLMLPPPEQPYPMLPPSQEPYLMILPTSSPNKPPAQVRSDSYISDVTVSIYPQGGGISTVQNAAVESTALVLYDSSQNPKSPDPEERILKSQEKASNRQYRPDPKECARRSQNAILRVNNGPNREQDDNTLLVFSPAENRAPT